MTRGVLAAALTPFERDGSVAYDRIPDYLTFLLERGTGGLFVLGTNGEFASLTAAERRAVLERFRAHAPADLPLVVNAGATSLAEVLELTRHARDVGATGVALLPPYYFPLTDEGFLRLARLAADAFGAPITLYNIPRYTGYAIPLTVLRTLAGEGVARGLKDSSQDMEAFAAARAALPALELFIGSDTTLIEGLRAGADGVVSGLANTFPELVAAAWRAFRDGRDLDAIAAAIRKLRTLFGRYPYLAATRYALALRGLDPGPPRLPLIDLNEAQRLSLARELAGFELPAVPWSTP